MSERRPGLKRSTAIERLYEFVTHNQLTFTSKADAADIIGFIENELGMKPPTRDADLRSMGGFARVEEWEPE